MYEQIKVYFYQYLFNSRCFKFARCNSHAKKMPARRLALICGKLTELLVYSVIPHCDNIHAKLNAPSLIAS